MKRVLAGLALSIVSLSAASADPLSEARDGKLQCYRPDAARKTCAALASYAFDSSGAISNTAEVLLAPQPVLTMRTVSPVTVKGEAVCGFTRKEDIDNAVFTLNGAALPDEQAAGVRAQILGAMQAMMGKEICTTYVPAGDRLSAQVTLDGVAAPNFSQQVVWVKPEDGYKVAP
jgi:hypothetical protein